jgi:gas vesicle protein
MAKISREKKKVNMGYKRLNGKKSFAIGAIVGSVVGGLTALLLAPKSGERLRKDIANKYNEVSDKTCEIFNTMCAQTSELVDKAKDIACCAKEAAHKICRRD